jgi:hypothetical protein
LVDHETDYLTKDFLYTLLIAQRNIVIYPYLLPQKLESLVEILGVFYTIQQFDTSNLSEESSLCAFCQSINDENAASVPNGTKQTFLIFTNGSQQILAHIDQFPALRFISIEKNLPVSLRQIDAFLVYNKKQSQFENYTVDLAQRTAVELDASHWVDFMISEIQTKSEIHEIIPEFQAFWNNAQEFAINMIQKQAFSPAINELSSLERNTLQCFCTAYFRLNFETLPNQVLPPIKDPSAEPYMELNLLQLNYPDFARVFQRNLHAIFLENGQQNTDPISKYIALRQSQWHEVIPAEFLNHVLLEFTIEMLKTHPITSTGLDAYIHQLYQQMLDILSTFPASPTFKDPRKLPIADFHSKIMPQEVLKQTQEILPKAYKVIGAPSIANPAPVVITNDDFETRYQHHLRDLQARFQWEDPDLEAKLTSEKQQLFARFNIQD